MTSGVIGANEEEMISKNTVLDNNETHHQFCLDTPSIGAVYQSMVNVQI